MDGAPLNTSPDAANPRPTHARYVVMAFLCVLSFLTYFDRVCIVQAQQEIQRDLHLSDQQMGLVLSAFWLAYALFEIPSGWLGDRYGTRGTLTRIVIAWSLFTGLSGAANGFVLLLLFRFCFGAGEAGAFPNMAKIQQVWLPVRSRERAGGLLWLAARWGGALSPIVFAGLIGAFGSPRFRHAFAGVPILERVAPWRLGFFVSASVGFVWVVLFYVWFKESPDQKSSVNAAERALIAADRRAEESRPTARFDRQTWRQLFSSPSLWAMGIYYICGSFGWNFFLSWMPRYFLDVHGIQFQKSAWFSGLPLLCGGISCLVGGVISDALVNRMTNKRLARAALPVVGCLTAAAAIFCIRLSGNTAVAIVLMCLTAAAYDFGQAANWATWIDLGGKYAATAAGLINSVGNLGNSLQGPIGAYLFSHYGWSVLFAVYAAAFAIAGSMWLIINPRRTFYGQPAALAQSDL